MSDMFREPKLNETQSVRTRDDLQRMRENLRGQAVSFLSGAGRVSCESLGLENDRSNEKSQIIIRSWSHYRAIRIVLIDEIFYLLVF
mmetsp:Transcript_4580/g.7362  ORF Transcript_4580/g.7362 Transcript_4580/m.7362 type:complete len:87 (+) Transcript_4580:319-579(+)